MKILHHNMLLMYDDGNKIISFKQKIYLLYCIIKYSPIFFHDKIFKNILKEKKLVI